MDFLKSIKKISIYVLCAAVFCSCSKKNLPERSTQEMYGFDTYISITRFGNNDFGEKELLEKLDSEFSGVYRTTANNVSGENILECAELSRQWKNEYGSIFGDSVNFTCGTLTRIWGISSLTPRVPEEFEIESALGTITSEDLPFDKMPSGTMLDFGASAKGFACDKIKALLDGNNAECGIISLGSSMLLYGEKPDKTQFSAAVRDPFADGSGYLGIIKTDGAFISTSGGYERFFEQDGVKYEHILSPETGYPVETDLVSVTVIAPSDTENGGIYTDLLATAIYAGGTKALKSFAAKDSVFDIVAEDKDKRVYVKGVDFTLDGSSGAKIAKNLR